MKKMLGKYYFAYGSNLNKNQMKKRCPDSEPVAKAMLAGYELTFKENRRGNGVADIQPKNGDSVAGALYRISEADRNALDICEGYPTVYNRHNIKVLRQDTGEEVEVFAYRMSKNRKLTPPRDYYFDIITEGYRHWHINDEKLQCIRLGLIKRCNELEKKKKSIFKLIK